MNIRWLILPITAGALTLAAAERDPFWPIGFEPTDLTAEPGPGRPVPVATVTPEVVRELSDVELRALADEEARRISNRIVQKGTMQTGGKIFAYLEGENIVVSNNNPWVTVGDHFFVQVHGQRYRMEVVLLTKSRIELKPHRVANQP